MRATQAEHSDIPCMYNAGIAMKWFTTSSSVDVQLYSSHHIWIIPVFTNRLISFLCPHVSMTTATNNLPICLPLYLSIPICVSVGSHWTGYPPSRTNGGWLLQHRQVRHICFLLVLPHLSSGNNCHHCHSNQRTH